MNAVPRGVFYLLGFLLVVGLVIGFETANTNSADPVATATMNLTLLFLAGLYVHFYWGLRNYVFKTLGLAVLVVFAFILFPFLSVLAVVLGKSTGLPLPPLTPWLVVYLGAVGVGEAGLFFKRRINRTRLTSSIKNT